MDSYLDMDIMSIEQKPQIHHHHPEHQHHGNYSSTDGVVPEATTYLPGPVVDGFPSYEMDFAGSKPYLYNFNSQSISQSVCSLSLLFILFYLISIIIHLMQLPYLVLLVT